MEIYKIELGRYGRSLESIWAGAILLLIGAYAVSWISFNIAFIGVIYGPGLSSEEVAQKKIISSVFDYYGLLMMPLAYFTIYSYRKWMIRTFDRIVAASAIGLVGVALWAAWATSGNKEFVIAPFETVTAPFLFAILPGYWLSLSRLLKNSAVLPTNMISSLYWMRGRRGCADRMSGRDRCSASSTWNGGCRSAIRCARSARS